MSGPSDPRRAQTAHLGGLSRTELAAAVGSLVWVAFLSGFAWVNRDAEPASLLGMLVLLILPLVLVGLALFALRVIGTLQEEASALRAALESLRSLPGAGHPVLGSVAVAAAPPAPEQIEPARPGAVALPNGRREEPATFQTRRDAALTVPSANRKAAHAAPQPQPDLEEPGLALGAPPEPAAPQIAMADLIVALQFPENAEDREGFRALRAALDDRRVAKLIRAAQDVLTLLSQEGIYMDDLRPEMARPDLWRRFAAGERGRSVAAIGGIRDRASLALTSRRMREDTIFRDAAHHFLRTFDHTFAFVEPGAKDAEIAALADTRTARAFMLFGRVTGTFD